MVATLTRLFGPHHLELAEDMVQETLLQALQQWSYRGVPDNPGGWIVTVAKNKALDFLRREANFQNKLERIFEDAGTSADFDTAFDDPLGDDQLTMMFICCHPALPKEARLALTLKTVGGFGVSEIARACLMPDATIAQRLVRAKRLIRERPIPFELPAERELPERLESVLEVLYLLFNEGYKANEGESLIKQEVCAEAVRLCSLLAAHPVGDRPTVHALLALMWLQASRLATRLDAEGNLLLLSEQDRSQWDQRAIHAGLFHLQKSAAGETLTEYHLQAGIAACHAAARSYEETDWVSILHAYTQLMKLNPSPILTLNWAVALAMVQGPEAGLAALARIQDHPQLQRYYLLPATFGEFYARSERQAEAIVAYRTALSLTTNEAERRFLLKKIGNSIQPQ